MSEQRTNRMSAAERANESSCAVEANERAMQANKQDERVTQYFSPDSRLFWISTSWCLIGVVVIVVVFVVADVILWGRKVLVVKKGNQASKNKIFRRNLSVGGGGWHGSSSVLMVVRCAFNVAKNIIIITPKQIFKNLFYRISCFTTSTFLQPGQILA